MAPPHLDEEGGAGARFERVSGAWCDTSASDWLKEAREEEQEEQEDSKLIVLE